MDSSSARHIVSYVHFKSCVSDFVTLYALFVWKYLFDNHKICAYALVVMLYGGAYFIL